MAAEDSRAAEPGPAAQLRAHHLRATPQRRAILDAFAGGDAEHLSADEVHARASARVDGIGRGTVYATLAELSERGLIAAVGDQDPVRYEINTAHHDHFRCRLCTRLFDIRVRRPSTQALSDAGYTVESVAVVATGICALCENYSRGLSDGANTVTRRRTLDDATVSLLGCVRHDTDFGPLVLAATPDGIARVAFQGHADFPALAERARSRRGGRAARDRASALCHGVTGFLGGEHGPLEDLVDWTLVGDQLRGSLEALHALAWGTHTSYHRLDSQGAEAYDYGKLIGSNPVPLVFPCHRVTCGARPAEHYVGGDAARRWLAAHEV